MARGLTQCPWTDILKGIAWFAPCRFGVGIGNSEVLGREWGRRETDFRSLYYPNFTTIHLHECVHKHVISILSQDHVFM